jgi:hypothetical protein
MSANDTQVGGEHYKQHGSTGEQHWDRVYRLGLDYYQGQITKYVERCWDKNGIQDLEKAQHFIAKYIELSRLALRAGKAEMKQAEATLRAEQTFEKYHELNATHLSYMTHLCPLVCSHLRVVELRMPDGKIYLSDGYPRDGRPLGFPIPLASADDGSEPGAGYTHQG